MRNSPGKRASSDVCAMGANKRRDRCRPARDCSRPPQRTLFMRKSPGKRASSDVCAMGADSAGTAAGLRGTVAVRPNARLFMRKNPGETGLPGVCAMGAGKRRDRRRPTRGCRRPPQLPLIHAQ